MKTFISILLVLSTALYAKQNYKFDISNVNTYNRTIPALSLAFSQNKENEFQVILSYVSTTLSLKRKFQSNKFLDDYSNINMSFNFNF